MPFTGSSTWSDPKTITAMPNWVDRCVTYPDITSTWADHFFVVTSSSGRMRITSTTPSGNVNLRRFYGMPRPSVMGDSEVRSSLYAVSNAGFATTANYQWGHVHRMTSTKQLLYRGTLTGTPTATTAADSTKAFVAHDLVAIGANLRECFFSITNGTGSREQKRILDNTTTGVTVSAAFTTTPVAGDTYEISTFVNRGITVVNTVAAANHAVFQTTAFDGGFIQTNQNPVAGTDVNGFLDSGTYMNPLGIFGPFVALPWHLKSRVNGTLIEAAVWANTDPEPDYGTAGQSASWTVLTGFEQPGLSGVYAGHIPNAAYMEYDDIRVRPL